ncbi:MAG: FecR family protein [Bacteroidales bacterium]|nr:FecR family protein [Bacteroidales bacterium]
MKTNRMMNKEKIIKFLLGETGKEENHLVNQWLNENDENKKYFDEIAFVWKTSGIAQNIEQEDVEKDRKIFIQKIGALLDEETMKSTEPVRRNLQLFRSSTGAKYYQWLRIAAIFILAFCLSWTVFYFANRKPDTGSLVYNQIITTKGQKSQIILSDGTKVWLNSETTLKYSSAFNEKKREVFLEGEAFFEVQKKGNKIPFIVKTSEIDIKVLGTSFNVMAYPDEETIETTVVKGSVCIVRKDLISSPDQNIILKSNQKVTLLKKESCVILSEIETKKPTLIKSTKTIQSISSSEKAQILVSPEVDIELHTAWKDDRLIFQSETFENICYKLERWYDVKIHVRNEELKKYRYTGKFVHKETINQVLEILKLTTPINYTFIQNDLYIDKVAE